MEGIFMEYKIMDGNEACARVAYMFTDVAGIYPITPSSPMAELTDSWAKSGKLNFFGHPVNIIEMQSEAGAAGMVHGSLLNGCLTSTYTASQGLLLMIPNMYKIAGEQLPCVINVAARSLATHALSIFGDHQDIYATRATGFAILASSSVQQVMDLTSVAYLSATSGKVPFLNFFDGFRTSHELQKIEMLDFDKVKDLIDQDALKEFRSRALNPDHPVTKGTNQNDDIYFQIAESRNKYYDALPDVVAKYMNDISAITGRSYKPFNYYGSASATRVIVAMGSVCETVKETVDYLNERGENVGLIEVHLYRPFSAKHFLSVLPESVTDIAVLDRTKEAGASGEPLFLDVCAVLKESNKKISVVGGRYGLSSKNTTPGMIKAVYDFLMRDDKFNGFTIGIEDDVTARSLPYEDLHIRTQSVGFLVYGYGSDGMVSAGKDIMKITGGYTNAFVQGYFQYDSKKSGGVTIGHLRFGKEPIRSTYYVENPDVVVLTKDSYLQKYEMLNKIKNHGIFLINTTKNADELNDALTDHDKEILKNRNIKIYYLDAEKIAESVGLGRKISAIMETVIFKVTKLIDFDFAKEHIKEGIHKKFDKKGNQIAEKNIAAIDKALEDLHVLDYNDLDLSGHEEEKDHSLFAMIDRRLGDSLPVSAFKDTTDGTFEAGTTKFEKRGASDMAPKWIPENCIMCNQCSLVCPHGVIRPFLLNEEEVQNAPESVKKNLIPANIPNQNLMFTIGISVKDCTGCKSCVNVCPGKKGEKALIMEAISMDEKDKVEAFNYLYNHVSEKKVMPKKTVKGSQFVKPKFEFSGACAGCGETPYLKLITQLFGDNMVIANATGCSSIYGASAPAMPYAVPWVNSLFEDNAEFGFGMSVADTTMKENIKDTIAKNISLVPKAEVEVYQNYIDHFDTDSAQALYDIVDNTKIPGLKEMKEFIKKKSFWIVGGDGWAYDIGYGGIDHVLANHQNVNILVLDTEVYSNTGGQSSKSTRTGAIAKFAANGKVIAKKDLAAIAVTYPHVYVGAISLGGNQQHAIKTLMEAEAYDGPSIIIAYSPCISHGILKGMDNSIQEERLATMSGYFPLFHRNPSDGKFILDSKADFDQYVDFVNGEDRYRMLRSINPEHCEELIKENKEHAMERYHYYERLQALTNPEEKSE